jgi:hypothetical protein
VEHLYSDQDVSPKMCLTNLMAREAYFAAPGREKKRQSARQSIEMTHCRDMMRQSESLPNRDFTPDEGCSLQSAWERGDRPGIASQTVPRAV